MQRVQRANGRTEHCGAASITLNKIFVWTSKFIFSFLLCNNLVNLDAILKVVAAFLTRESFVGVNANSYATAPEGMCVSNLPLVFLHYDEHVVAPVLLLHGD